jgi:hypothetical protein
MLFNGAFRWIGIKLIYYPAAKSWFDVSSWWQSKEGRRAVGLEYTKMIPNALGTWFNDFANAVRKKALTCGLPSLILPAGGWK